LLAASASSVEANPLDQVADRIEKYKFFRRLHAYPNRLCFMYKDGRLAARVAMTKPM
jgi:hypothetical protein